MTASVDQHLDLRMLGVGLAILAVERRSLPPGRPREQPYRRHSRSKSPSLGHVLRRAARLVEQILLAFAALRTARIREMPRERRSSRDLPERGDPQARLAVVFGRLRQSG